MKHIGETQVPMTRRQLQTQFIGYAIKRQLVDDLTMKEYVLTNDRKLKQLFGVERFPVKDIFKVLLRSGIIKAV